ncbi:MAG TPA: AraC family transcriptional regulator [Clostridiales bacterium]|nr:AraC family transcriptional regulator [Clostridiales bacterium]
MGIKVLIVDDEENSVKTLQAEIDWDRYGIDQVFGAYSAEEARNVLKQEAVNLLLCDIEMPGESGLEFIEWIREGTRLAGFNMECIILTCYPEYNFMRKAMQLGCSDYLIKPIDYQELYQVIEKAVRRIEENREEEMKQDMVQELLSDSEKQDIIHTKVIPYIRENITNPFTITDIAKYAALNPQYMMRLFKKTTGKSIVEYVTAYKMEMAKELLKKSQWTNEIIAEKVGYVSSNYFIKLFKKQYGITPREYRKQLGGK